MLKQESKRLGAHDYKVTQLDAIRGRRALVRLGKIAGPALAATQTGKDEEEKLAAGLTKLVELLSEEDVDYFCDLFASLTSVSGGQYGKASPQLDGVFATHFADRYGEMIQWLVFAMKVNFGSFFAEARLQLAKRADGASS